MKKAFLFDMDGVIVNTEQVWKKYGQEFQENVFGRDILGKIGDRSGFTLRHLHSLATEYGFSQNLEDVTRAYDDFMDGIYQKTTVTSGLERLLKGLKTMGFTTGVVSSSRRLWIDLAFRKISYKHLFGLIFSLDEENIPSKPSPEGYIAAMKKIGSDSKTTFILEDSNAGLQSAKASGAFTIAFTQLLVPGYHQQIEKADAVANSMKEVLEIVKKHLSS